MQKRSILVIAMAAAMGMAHISTAPAQRGEHRKRATTTRPAESTAMERGKQKPSTVESDFYTGRYALINELANKIRGGGALLGGKKRETDRGKDVVDEYMKKYPNDEYTPHVMFLGGLYDYFHYPNYSKELYETILSKYPDHPRAKTVRLYLPTVYEELGEWGKAAECWQNVIKMYPGAADIEEFKTRYRMAKAQADFKKGKKRSLDELRK
ncbi:tol-pal system YbgF family protein [Candidatus Hydrogenedentota bacterium]